jgi:hypothetical protein
VKLEWDINDRCPMPGPGFPTSYVMDFLYVQLVEGRKVIVRFVDIGGIVNHYCLNFLFKMTKFPCKIFYSKNRYFITFH